MPNNAIKPTKKRVSFLSIFESEQGHQQPANHWPLVFAAYRERYTL
jgi:hypothetical protein